MKLKLITAGIIALSLATSAFAADVTVNVTGATAFRAATLDAIKAKFIASGAAFKFAHDKTASGTNFNGSTRSIWIGTFPGVTGTTTIRCCFTGSVEGIRSLIPTVVDLAPPTYLPSSVLTSTTAIIGGAELGGVTTGATALGAISDIAFSDVTKASTPYKTASLQPGSPAAGVIVFTMMANEGSSVTNVTSQQFKALLTNGFQPLSLFTGIAADTTNVYGIGRNDGSGTRTTVLAETGYGVSKTIKQYATITSNGTNILAIQEIPAGGVNVTPYHANLQAFITAGNTVTQSTSWASTIWPGQNVAGNGGYNSGGDIKTDLGKVSGSGVTVFAATGAYKFGSSTRRVDLLTWLSVNDAVGARDAGGIMCAFNGVKLNDIAAYDGPSGNAELATMSATDLAKVTEGSYTAWGYENMYLRNDVTSGDKLAVYNGIKGAIPTNLAAAGIPIASMNVSRTVDGGTVAP